VLNTVKILQIVRALPDGEITVDVNERGRAVISGGAFRFEITAAPGTDFPSMPMFVGDKIWQIPQRTLKFLLTKTVYAVGQNDSRAALNGALLSIRDGTLTVVGSDGFRIATAKAALPVSDSPIPDAQLLIPGRFLGELLHLLRDSDDTLPMLLGRKHVIFTVDNLRFFTRLIDTEYIPYEQFMLVSPKTEVFVSRSLLRDAVESVSVVTEDKLGGSGRSHIKLDIISTGVALSSVSSGGSVSGTVPADVSGQDITIAFTCRYLLDALRAVPEDCDTLKIVLNSPGTGILITPAHSDSFTDFILPYRIGK